MKLVNSASPDFDGIRFTFVASNAELARIPPSDLVPVLGVEPISVALTRLADLASRIEDKETGA